MNLGRAFTPHSDLDLRPHMYPSCTGEAQWIPAWYWTHDALPVPVELKAQPAIYTTELSKGSRVAQPKLSSAGWFTAPLTCTIVTRHPSPTHRVICQSWQVISHGDVSWIFTAFARRPGSGPGGRISTTDEATTHGGQTGVLILDQGQGFPHTMMAKPGPCGSIRVRVDP